MQQARGGGRLLGARARPPPLGPSRLSVAVGPQWLEELDLYATTQYTAKLLVGNKIDVQQRAVTPEEAMEFARTQAMMYLEASAKTRAGVRQAFDEVVQKILDTPDLLAASASVGGSTLRSGVPADEGGGLCGYC